MQERSTLTYQDKGFILRPTLLLKMWYMEPHSEVLYSTPHSPEGVHMQPVNIGGYMPATPWGGDQGKDSEFRNGRNSKRDILCHSSDVIDTCYVLISMLICI